MENSSTSKRSQLSPELWPANAFYIPYTLLAIAGFAALGIGTAIVLFTFAAPLFGLHARELDARHLVPSQTTALFAMQDFVYIPVIALVLFLTPLLAKRTLTQLGLGAPRMRDVRNGLLSAVAAWVLVALVSLLWDVLTKKAHHQSELQLFSHLDLMQSIVSGITAVIIAPLAEEIAFRFFLLNALLRYAQSIVDTIASWSSTRRPSVEMLRHTAAALAIAIDGALFGFAHGQLDVVPALAACGIVLATAYYRTSSLWTNVIAHACFNGVTTIALLVFHFEG